MTNQKDKYSLERSLNHRLWHDSNGNYRDYRDWTPHQPVIPIDKTEQSLIDHVSSTLSNLPTYSDLETEAREQDRIVDISEHLSLPDPYIVFLENDTTPIRTPKDKPATNGPIYYRGNWRLRVGTINDLITRLEMGLAISMGMCDRFGDTLRQGVLWYGAYGIALDCDEFADGTQNKAHRPDPCYSMDEFLNMFPQIQEFARYIIPSARSLYQGRPFKARAFVPFEVPVYDYRVFQRIANKLNQMFLFLPEGVTKNGIASAFGAAHNAHIARYFDGCMPRDLIEACQREVIAERKHVKEKAQQHKQREQERQEHREQQDRIRTELKARGHEIQDTQSPIEAFMAAVNPIDYMESRGWITAIGGNAYHWHESGQGKSCEIDTTGDTEAVIKPFSASIQAASPNTDPTAPVGGHRFILFQLYGLDVSNDAHKSELRRRLADDGYGTHPDAYKKIREAEQHAAKAEGVAEQSATHSQPQTEIDDDFVKRILDGTLETPKLENVTIEKPAYRYWTPEERILCERILGRNPDAGWYQKPDGVWTPEIITSYKNFASLTGLESFRLNGHPSEIEKRRLFFAHPSVCPKCHDTAALSIDKCRLTAHAYCPKCHIDTQIGAYLDYELNRKIENVIVSKHKGFLGDNPDFQDFELFRPHILTYLGAAMATGKTTEMIKEIIRRVTQENKRGILCVPRISLARAIAHYFREKHGTHAWGLWHEGSGKSNQFIGTYGAIVCLPSLANVVDAAYEQGFTINDLLITIDEVDFSYNLLNIAIKQKTRIKQILTEAVHTNGISVAGQTEFILALEGLACELGLQTSDIHAFYNTASVAKGIVEINTYPDVEGKNDIAIADAIEKIRERLAKGKNVYTFCHERRIAQMIAKAFSHHNPVLYDRYHKGEKRADDVLLNQKLTDTNLFIATSAAGVGINIHDKNGETVIIAGAVYGQRDIPDTTQKIVRNRGRMNVYVYLQHYTTPLPLAPEETEKVSRYEHGLKLTENGTYKTLPEAAIKRFSATTALLSLADTDPMTFIRHHIEKVAGMKVVEKKADLESSRDVQTIKDGRTEMRDEEQNAVTQRILEIINAPKLHIMTSAHIRAQGALGKLIPMPTEQLAQEKLNLAAQALGYDDTEKNDFSFIDKNLLTQLILNIKDFAELKKQYNGWLAVHHNEWMHQQLEQKLKQKKHTDGGTGKEVELELTDIEDHRIRGGLLTKLLETLTGNTYTQSTLADTVKKVLKTRYGHDTFWTLIQNGALSIKEYRAARFWHTDDDEGIGTWVRNFVKDWYPARIAKKDNTYYLTPQTHAELKTKVFQNALATQLRDNPDDDDDRNTPPFMDGFCETPDPRSEQKTLARQLVAQGNTPADAAQKTGLPYKLVCKITKDIRDAAKTNQIETARKLREQGNTLQDIATQLGVKEPTVSKWCKGIGESHMQSHILSKSAMNFLNVTRNWKKTADLETHVTLQKQILNLLSEGEKSTGDIINAADGKPTSIKNELKKLTDAGEILKIKHGVYALPHVSDEITQSEGHVTDKPVDEPILLPASESTEPQRVELETENDLWYAIYLIQNALLDRQTRTPTKIETQTELSNRLMYHKMLLNTPGVGESVGMDTDAAEQCYTPVLSQIQTPYLRHAHFCLLLSVSLQKDGRYFEKPGQLWRRMLEASDTRVNAWIPIRKTLAAQATVFHKKALQHKSVKKQKMEVNT